MSTSSKGIHSLYIRVLCVHCDDCQCDSDRNYCLVEEDGGHGVFELVQRAQLLIRSGRLDVPEYHKLVRVMFRQMVEAVAFCHQQNVCHFDVSLENFLVSWDALHYLCGVNAI